MEKHKHKKILWSVVIATGFLFLSYFISNLNFPISGEKAILYRFELIKNYFFPQESTENDSILLIDVSYDKTPVKVTDEYDMPMGEIQITDRQKLLQLLQELKRKNDYKYILLDVFFGQKGRTPQDSALFATICSMPRIAIPCHSDEALADSSLTEKAGFADYTTTFKESGFVKYPYMSDSGKSLSLKMYEDITGRTIDKHWLIYTDGYRLVRKSIVLTFDVNVTAPYDENGDKVLYYLGADILGNDENRGLLYEFPELTKNKYIAIGAFNGDDNHSTYVGNVCGTLINLNAYFSLLHNNHVVSPWLAIILYFAFFILAYLTLTRQNLREFANNLTQKQKGHLKAKLVALSALCSWLGYSFFLTILCILTYMLLGEVYEVIITSTLFYLLALSIKFSDKIKKISKLWKRKG